MMHVCRLRWIKVTKQQQRRREGEEKKRVSVRKANETNFVDIFVEVQASVKGEGSVREREEGGGTTSDDECTLEIYFEITFFKYFF